MQLLPMAAAKMHHNKFNGSIMGIFDDIKAKGAAYRLTEEALYAEALREIESGQRRDGIWAKAMAESDMDQDKAGAKYIKLRVQSLKDEVTVFIAGLNRVVSESQKQIPLENIQTVSKSSSRVTPAVFTYETFETIVLLIFGCVGMFLFGNAFHGESALISIVIGFCLFIWGCARIKIK